TSKVCFIDRNKYAGTGSRKCDKSFRTFIQRAMHRARARISLALESKFLSVLLRIGECLKGEAFRARREYAKETSSHLQINVWPGRKHFSRLVSGNKIFWTEDFVACSDAAIRQICHRYAGLPTSKPSRRKASRRRTEYQPIRPTKLRHAIP